MEQRLPQCGLTIVVGCKARCTKAEGLWALQGYKVPEGLRATGSMADAVERAEVILMVVPTQFVARTMTDLAKLLQPNQVPCTLDLILIISPS